MKAKRREVRMIGDAEVTLLRSFSPASVWNVGDGIWGYERRRKLVGVRHDAVVGVFTGVLLVSKDGKYRTMAQIEGPTWKSVCDAVRELGFSRPKLLARDLIAKAA